MKSSSKSLIKQLFYSDMLFANKQYTNKGDKKGLTKLKKTKLMLATQRHKQLGGQSNQVKKIAPLQWQMFHEEYLGLSMAKLNNNVYSVYICPLCFFMSSLCV